MSNKQASQFNYICPCGVGYDAQPEQCRFCGLTKTGVAVVASVEAAPTEAHITEAPHAEQEN